MIAAIWKPGDPLGPENPRGLKRNKRRGGFTLMELLLAIGLMGLVMGMAFPRFGNVRSTFFATEADRGLANSVRAARLSAIRGRTIVALTVAYGADGLLQERQLPRRAWDGDEIDGFSVKEVDWESVWEAPVIRTFEVAGVVRLVSTEPASSERGIVFFPNGTSNGGRILVTDEDGNLVSHYLVDPHTSELFTQ